MLLNDLVIFHSTKWQIQFYFNKRILSDNTGYCRVVVAYHKNAGE